MFSSLLVFVNDFGDMFEKTYQLMNLIEITIIGFKFKISD